MTVCIAVPTKTPQGVPVFVLCADGKIEGVYTKEQEDKLFRLGKNWVSLGSGHFAHWLAFCKQLRRTLLNVNGALSFDRFVVMVREALEAYRTSAIFASDASFECIFTGFEGWKPRIFAAWIFKDSVQIVLDYSFMAVGSGGPTAAALLSYRGCSALTKFEDAIYMAYEAKRLSEKCPGVGGFTQIMIHGPNVLNAGAELCGNYLTEDCLAELEKHRQRLFVREISGVEIKPECFKGDYPFRS